MFENKLYFWLNTHISVTDIKIIIIKTFTIEAFLDPNLSMKKPKNNPPITSPNPNATIPNNSYEYKS